MSAIAIKPLRVARATKQFKHGSRFLAAGLVGSSALAAYFYHKNNNNGNNNKNNGSKALGLMAGSAVVNHAAIPEGKDFKDYQQVYNEIAEKIADNLEYDENSGFYGQLTRLAWHTSGTYKKSDNTGGSYPGTMIYSQEAYDGANRGLEAGREFLIEFRDKYPWISRGDLWTLGGVAAVQEAGGPKIPWRPGRKDSADRKIAPENGRLPDAAQEDPKYVRDLFARMGFNERETVALIGAHCLGRCHVHNSGFEGPWGPSFNMFTNDFYVRLLQDWHVKDWSGNRQYEDDETKSFMMLPTDIALKKGSYFVKYVKMYAEDQDLFFKDFSKAFATLLELGVTFPKNSKPFEFKTLDEQDDE